MKDNFFIFRCFLFGVLIQTLQTGYGQTVIGFQFNVNKNYFELNDPAGQIDDKGSATGSGILTISRLFGNNLFLETGFGIKGTKQTISMAGFMTTSSGPVQLQVPLLVGYRIKVDKINLNIFPTLGIIGGNQLSADSSILTTTMSTQTNSLFLTSVETYPNAYSLAISGGVRIEYLLSPRWAISFAMSYTKGNTIILHEEINYGGKMRENHATRDFRDHYFSLFCLRTSYYIPWKKT